MIRVSLLYASPPGIEKYSAWGTLTYCRLSKTQTSNIMSIAGGTVVITQKRDRRSASCLSASAKVIGMIDRGNIMKLAINTSAFLFIFVASFSSTASRAHSDLEKPLFVATNGIDNGRCHDSDNPCQTISYALTMAGKGGQIRVAGGSYAVKNTEDLFHIISGVVDIRGGFQRSSNFSAGQEIATQLVGVPAQYRSAMLKKGFQIVADGKGMDGAIAAETQNMLALHQKLKVSASAEPCINGQAAGLECDSVDLLAHIALEDFSGGSEQGADVWGFLDLNSNREYAIMGLDIGTAIVDVTDPENPFEIGLALGPMAVWRDIKVYQFFDTAADRWKAYAYVTTDGSNDGMIVVDLTGLPHEINRMNYSSDFTAAHNVYATGLDFATGLSQTGTTPSLIIAGPNVGSGQFRAYSLADPLQPSFIATATSPDYMHDAASMLITDPRKDTQCINATTYCEVLFDFNETTVDIWDITDISNPQRLSQTPYANSGYVHSGWWSEDRQYMFVHDELDEQRSGLQTTLRVFSLTDLTAPTLAATWTGATAAIDHNGFVRGSRYYMSNYSQGLTILDISDPTQPAEVGRIDTYPFSQSANFVGAWGTYPFFPSGTVAISDIDSGFYLVRDQTRSVAEGNLNFSAASYSATEGGQSTLAVQRIGGSTGNVSVDYEILAATADGADYQLSSGLLSWAVGDTADKSITLTIPDDGMPEPMEHLIVRLLSPGGGATLGDLNTANLFLNDAGAQPEFEFLDETVNSSETGMNTVILVVQRRGSAAGQASVDYAISGGDASIGLDFDGDTNGSLVWTDGDGLPKSLTISIIDDSDAESTEFFEMTLSNPQGGTIATTSTSRVNITSNEGPAPPPAPTPPPTSSGGGGGGAPAPLALLVLGLLLLQRKQPTGS